MLVVYSIASTVIDAFALFVLLLVHCVIGVVRLIRHVVKMFFINSLCCWCYY